MNAMPPDPAFRGPTGARVARPARGDTAVARSSGCASSTTGRTGGRARSPPTTTRSRRRSSTSAAGWTRTSTRRCGCRRAAPPRAGRSSATGSTAGRRRRTPGPNLDELHEIVRFFDRWLKGIPNGADEEPAITWFEREYAEPEPFPAALPGRWRAATAYPHPVGRRCATWRFAGGSVPLVGRLGATARGGRRAGGRSLPPPRRPSGRGPPCRGAPADRRTASRATCVRTRRSVRPTPPSRSRTAVEILGVPGSSSTSRSRRRSRRRSCG